MKKPGEIPVGVGAAPLESLQNPTESQQVVVEAVAEITFQVVTWAKVLAEWPNTGDLYQAEEDLRCRSSLHCEPTEGKVTLRVGQVRGLEILDGSPEPNPGRFDRLSLESLEQACQIEQTRVILTQPALKFPPLWDQASIPEPQMANLLPALAQSRPLRQCRGEALLVIYITSQDCRHHPDGPSTLAIFGSKHSGLLSRRHHHCQLLHLLPSLLAYGPNYLTDQDMVRAVTACLDGEGAKWVTHLHDEHALELGNINTFLQELRARFEDESKLKKLRLRSAR